MIKASSTSRPTLILAAVALSMTVAGTASAAPTLGAVTIGNGQSSGTHILATQTGTGPQLVTVTALSPQVSKEGSVANVKLLNDRTLVGVTGPQSTGAHGVAVVNPTHEPVLSPGFLSGVTGGVGSH